MDAKNGNGSKNIITYIGLFVAIGGLVVSIIISNHRIEATKSDAIRAQQQSDKQIYIQISLNKAEIADNSASIKKLDGSDDKNSVQINRIKDGLIIFATKDEVNSKFANFSTTVKTDILIIDSQMNNFNQRISYLEGAWQLWLVNYYRAPPVISVQKLNNSDRSNVYNSEMYK